MDVHRQMLPPGIARWTYHSVWTSILPYHEANNIYEDIDLNVPSIVFTGPLAHPHLFTEIPIYVCPSYPGRPVVREFTGVDEKKNGAILCYQALMGAITGDPSQPLEGSNSVWYYGQRPLNGMFGVGRYLAASDALDGLSNTLIVGEWQWVEPNGTIPTGSWVRPWCKGSSEPECSYSLKAVHWQKSPINFRIAAINTFYNHGPFSSFHPGRANFLAGDGSVRFLPESMDMAAYVSLATRDGGEVSQIP